MFDCNLALATKHIGELEFFTTILGQNNALLAEVTTTHVPA
jgi:hypothetical protein